MKYSEAKYGRIFVLRLEDGEVLHQTIETFAKEKNIAAATVFALGGADRESKLVVGPKERDGAPIVPNHHILDDVHEALGVGTIFPDQSGTPILHMHLAAGREDSTITGCIRDGVNIWQYCEIIIQELLESPAKRLMHPQLKAKLLDPGN